MLLDLLLLGLIEWLSKGVLLGTELLLLNWARLDLWGLAAGLLMAGPLAVEVLFRLERFRLQLIIASLV